MRNLLILIPLFLLFACGCDFEHRIIVVGSDENEVKTITRIPDFFDHDIEFNDDNLVLKIRIPDITLKNKLEEIITEACDDQDHIKIVTEVNLENTDDGITITASTDDMEMIEKLVQFGLQQSQREIKIGYLPRL